MLVLHGGYHNENKHLTIEERSTIKTMLDNSASFKSIARELGRHCTAMTTLRNTVISFRIHPMFAMAVINVPVVH